MEKYLPQRLKEKDFLDENIIKLGEDISNALILCEKEHMVHGNIKPSNILVSNDDEYKMSNLGGSENVDLATAESQKTGMEYQAPEVLKGEKYGHTADIYSLGMVMYWLLNDQTLPCRDEKLSPPANGSEKLKEIVMKACENRPEDRYATAQELYDALHALKSKRTMTRFGVIWAALVGISCGLAAILIAERDYKIIYAILSFSELFFIYYNFSRYREKYAAIAQTVSVLKFLADAFGCAFSFILIIFMNFDILSASPGVAYLVLIVFFVILPFLLALKVRSWSWKNE